MKLTDSFNSIHFLVDSNVYCTLKKMMKNNIILFDHWFLFYFISHKHRKTLHVNFRYMTDCVQLYVQLRDKPVAKSGEEKKNA